MKKENSYDFSRKDYEASETAGMVAGGPGNPPRYIKTVCFQMGEWKRMSKHRFVKGNIEIFLCIRSFFYSFTLFDNESGTKQSAII